MAEPAHYQNKTMNAPSKCDLKLSPSQCTPENEYADKSQRPTPSYDYDVVQCKTAMAHTRMEKELDYDVDDLISEGWSCACQGGPPSAEGRGEGAAEPYQLQLWAYETKVGNMTLAEKLEKGNWECVKH